MSVKGDIMADFILLEVKKLMQMLEEAEVKEMKKLKGNPDYSWLACKQKATSSSVASLSSTKITYIRDLISQVGTQECSEVIAELSRMQTLQNLKPSQVPDQVIQLLKCQIPERNTRLAMISATVVRRENWLMAAARRVVVPQWLWKRLQDVSTIATRVKSPAPERKNSNI